VTAVENGSGRFKQFEGRHIMLGKDGRVVDMGPIAKPELDFQHGAGTESVSQFLSYTVPAGVTMGLGGAPSLGKAAADLAEEFLPQALEGDPIIETTTERRARQLASSFAQVPGLDVPGANTENIPMNDLAGDSQGRNFNEMRARGIDNLGRRENEGMRREFFQHPDGHPNTPGSWHHRHPHFHANNGVSKIVVVYGRLRKLR
jgi:hypothetical protein